MPDYRPLEDGDLAAYLRLVSYAFRPEQPRPDRGAETTLPDPAIGDRRGLYADGELQCVAAHHWFTLDVRGDALAVAGLSGVATAPGRRRRGLVRELLAESLAEYRERDIGLASLWTFSCPFYRQYGWRVGSRFARTVCRQRRSRSPTTPTSRSSNSARIGGATSGGCTRPPPTAT